MNKPAVQQQPQPEKNHVAEIRSGFEKMKIEIQKALPAGSGIDPDRFIRVVMTAVQFNKDLVKADRQSLFGACLKCAQDGLLPDGREAALVIYNTNTGTKQKPNWTAIVQYLPMIAGIKKVAYASGEVLKWDLRVVKENDEFEYELGDNDRIIHKPAKTKRGDTIGAYAIVTLKNGEKLREYMDIEEIGYIRSRSRSPDRGPWSSDFDEMAKKTVGHRAYKSLPSSPVLDSVMSADRDFYQLDKPEPPQIAATPIDYLPGIDPRCTAKQFVETVWKTKGGTTLILSKAEEYKAQGDVAHATQLVNELALLEPAKKTETDKKEEASDDLPDSDKFPFEREPGED